MASISFTDGTGAATISSGWPAPANRFRNWRPNPQTIGERATGYGDGARYQWAGRIDYRASFELHGITRTNESVLQRFKLWADAGGTFTVTTGDSESNEYTTCGMAPGADVEILWDAKRGRFTVVVDAINRAASPVALRCYYA